MLRIPNLAGVRLFGPRFAKSHPDIQITPKFQYENGVESFLKNESDIMFALKENTKQIPGIQVHELFESHIYLISQRDDELASKNLLTEEEYAYGKKVLTAAGMTYFISLVASIVQFLRLLSLARRR